MTAARMFHWSRPVSGPPTSYLPGSGEYLTPNLVPGALSGGLVNAVGSAGANATGGVAGSSVMTGSSSVSVGSDGFPTVQSTSISAAEADALVSGTEYTGDYTSDYTEGGGFTEVTSDLYDSSNSLGRLEIPSIGVNVKVFQGTGSSSMAKGMGHFTETSIWDGNAVIELKSSLLLVFQHFRTLIYTTTTPKALDMDIEPLPMIAAAFLWAGALL